MENFVIQVLRGRWFMMFASFLIMAGAGATYLFGVYSKDIKSTLGYDQSTLNLLGSFKDVGANVGIVSGLIAEVTPTWFVLLIGSAMNFAGYFLIWLSVTKRIPKPRVWQMCLYICIGANSQNFANTGSLVTCVKNFPESRGMMLGLMKGFVGLSGAVFTQLYLAIYGNDSKSMILLIAWLPAVLSIIFIPSIRPMKISRHPQETWVLFEYLWISITMALCLMGLTITQKYVKFSHTAYVACATVVCVLLFLPFFISIREEYSTRRAMKKERKKKKVLSDSRSTSRVALDDIEEQPSPEPRMSEIVEVSEQMQEGAEGGKSTRGTGCFKDICKKPKRGDDYTILQALLSIDMLILFICNFCGQGCSLTAVDNLGQIGESLGYPSQTISTFVSLISIWNFFGRVFSGFVSEGIIKKWRVPRPLMMTLSLLVPVVGDLFIAFPFPGSIYVASLLIGFSYGVQLTLLFIIISELFGLKYYSTLFNCGQLASPIGSYILNVKIVGKLYDMEAVKQLQMKGIEKGMVKELTCMGKSCYRVSFIILAGVNFFGALVSLILVFRTRDYYKTDIYKRFKDEMEANEKEMADVAFPSLGATT
ncbi:unnamed protein product [Cuscuta europaea]|uniref:Nodulin-like domain-containing protein n=1 Tax=Cuscuta europaea TaxID=41803 RepID=A0A9P0YVR1_CUSEU|nr:unnamed protein product [Cuscuta europaea]